MQGEIEQKSNELIPYFHLGIGQLPMHRNLPVEINTHAAHFLGTLKAGGRNTLGGSKIPTFLGFASSRIAILASGVVSS
jgi:hypothetical protein